LLEIYGAKNQCNTLASLWPSVYLNRRLEVTKYMQPFCISCWKMGR